MLNFIDIYEWHSPLNIEMKEAGSFLLQKAYQLSDKCDQEILFVSTTEVCLKMITGLLVWVILAPRWGKSANYDHRDIYQAHIEKVLTSTNNFVISATVCYLCYRQS